MELVVASGMVCEKTPTLIEAPSNHSCGAAKSVGEYISKYSSARALPIPFPLPMAKTPAGSSSLFPARMPEILGAIPHRRAASPRDENAQRSGHGHLLCARNHRDETQIAQWRRNRSAQGRSG